MEKTLDQKIEDAKKAVADAQLAYDNSTTRMGPTRARNLEVAKEILRSLERLRDQDDDEVVE